MIHLLQPTNENWQFEMMIVSMVAEVLPAGLGREQRIENSRGGERERLLLQFVRSVGARDWSAEADSYPS